MAPRDPPDGNDPPLRVIPLKEAKARRDRALRRPNGDHRPGSVAAVVAEPAPVVRPVEPATAPTRAQTQVRMAATLDRIAVVLEAMLGEMRRR